MGEQVLVAAEGETYALVFHPGYVDAFVLGNSSPAAKHGKEDGIEPLVTISHYELPY